MPPSVIIGDLGGYPAVGDDDITGFALSAVDASSTFSTSAQIDGKVYAANHAMPTPPTVEAATFDMETAYTDAYNRENNDVSRKNVGAGAGIGGMTLTPGIYTWSTSMTFATDITLSGGPCDVFILQIANDFTIGANTSVILSGGVEAANIFWIVKGSVEIGSRVIFKVLTNFLFVFFPPSSSSFSLSNIPSHHSHHFSYPAYIITRLTTVDSSHAFLPFHL